MKTPEEKRISARAYCKTYHDKHRDKVNKKNTVWRKANPDYSKTYRAENRGQANAHAAKRRAAKLQRTPVWSETKSILGLYQLAAYLTEEHGRTIHVDHIIPLQGKEVSGLHCLSNLQLLYAEDNLSKSNLYVDNS